MTVPRWPRLSPHWRLGEGEVHVVRVDVPAARVRTAALTAALSAPERARAARFRHAADRDRHVIARGTLRVLLARGLAARGATTAPRDLVLGVGPWGKPFMTGRAPIAFNVSHSEGVVLLAFAVGREVGVDVEYARADLSIGELAAAAFTPEERTRLARVAPSDRRRLFFDLWTQKEALTKALGLGLGQPEVPPLPGADAPYSVRACGRAWTVGRLGMAPPYSAALAAEGTGWALRTWEYRPLEDADVSFHPV